MFVFFRLLLFDPRFCLWRVGARGCIFEHWYELLYGLWVCLTCGCGVQLTDVRQRDVWLRFEIKMFSLNSSVRPGFPSLPSPINE